MKRRLYLATNAVMEGFTLTNGAAVNGGGVSCESISAVLSNCVLTGNSGGGASGGTLNNCTLSGTSAYEGGRAADSTLNNCTLTGNTATTGTNYGSYCALNYCCTTPLPGGVGNITNPPLFVDYAGGNLRLQSNSPCINSGNNAYVTSSTDLDGTGMNVYQDWIAGLNPTNALSVSPMTSAAATNNPAGLVVTWGSVSGIMYFLQSGTNLAAQPAFTTLQSNMVCQAGTTSYMDTNAVGAGATKVR
jgi:hypothetical protein